jgi:hypothetical protein
MTLEIKTLMETKAARKKGNERNGADERPFPAPSLHELPVGS